MRKLLALFREAVKWWRIERAERLVTRYGYGVFHRAYVEGACEKVGELRTYAYHSGHLTRGFHAGKRMQRGLADVRGELLSAILAAQRPRRRVNPEHVGSVVALVLARIFSGGSRSW
jgi:hypothetical protein